MAFRMMRESALELIILIVIISLGLLMLGPTQGLMSTDTQSSSATRTNKSTAFATNNTWVEISGNPVQSITAIHNGSILLSATTNYSLYTPNRSVKLTVRNAGYLGTYDVTFVHTTYNVEYNATNTGLYALTDYTDWYSLIVVVIIFVAIIGIIYLIYGSAKGGV